MLGTYCTDSELHMACLGELDALGMLEDNGTKL